MQAGNVDLIIFPQVGITVEWPLGTIIDAQPGVDSLWETLNSRLNETSADWILFWDISLGAPDSELINQLAQKPVDVFHAGLKLGTAGLPDVLNYVHPTWMYNVDGSTDITHSNFRLSFHACMIRTSVMKKLGLFSTEYSSLKMAGIAFGYQILKQGGILRYHSSFVKGTPTLKTATHTLKDEWTFARQYFTRKWQYWTLFNKTGFWKNLSAWSGTKNVRYIDHSRKLFSSDKTNTPVTRATVSILAPTLDRYLYIEEELRELNEQTILPHEVLITDQTDKERRQEIDFTKYEKLTVKYFPQDEKGQCLAWNKLIDESTSEYIFFFGDDAYNIKPDLIEKMLQTMYRFDADMVASNVIEKGIVYGPQNYHYYMADSFPITLIKKEVVTQAGGMDMFFNRNVKADHDLAMRCHLNGALMIFDPSAEIGHHRAPSGGLRAHNARVITNFMTKNSLTKVLNPSTSEIFIYNKYYTWRQFKQHVRIKYFNQLLINGSVLKKILRLFVLLYKLPSMRKEYKANLETTFAEFDKRGIQVKK
ncbi:MAG: glycosyltransferase family 2 protein [Chitinophagales bacterium]|nr:glycosyltransferase family 2 protein [Chitinophagaceae bacterium]MCB9065392.1 glycosyltransferase family 2 protein [Chitinophagales bacterium]